MYQVTLVNVELDDCIILNADSLEQAREDVKANMLMRGWNSEDCFSEVVRLT